MKDLVDYIQVFKNIVPYELCDTTLKEFNAEDEWCKTVVGAGLRPDIRSAETVVISFPHIIEKNLTVRKQIDLDLFTSAATAIARYNEKFPLAKIQEDSGYELLRYKEGQFYTEHTDSFKDRPRAVSCSFALNDDYEGGEFAFFNRKLKYKIPKGSAILFPSNFMYPHEIMPVTKGTRYSIITWFI
jgi:hypothetical protein